MHLSKFFTIIIALLLTQQVVAQSLVQELIFLNNSTPAINIGGTIKPARRAPVRMIQLPICYYNESCITLTSFDMSYTLPYSIADDEGTTILSGVATITPYHVEVIDISSFPAGFYQFIITYDKVYCASFELE